MEKIRFIAIILTICFFYSGCTKDNPIILKEVEDVCEQMDDIKFMKYCYSKFDVNSDGKVSMTEAAAVKEIYVAAMSITSLNGIEYFTNLEELNCSTTKLTSLDVRKNLKLTELSCDHNNLTALDVSKNVKLTELNLGSNEITNIDVSKNIALTNLYCYDNNLTNLDVRKNVALTELSCNSNNLATLDVSKNVKLTELSCNYNNLTSLDVSKNVKLEYLNCENNPLEIIYLNNKHKDNIPYSWDLPSDAKIEYR